MATPIRAEGETDAAKQNPAANPLVPVRPLTPRTFCSVSTSSLKGLSARYRTLFQENELTYWSVGSEVQPPLVICTTDLWDGSSNEAVP